jgi:hypothetical protein
VFTTTIWEALIYRTLLGMYTMKLKTRNGTTNFSTTGYDVNSYLPDERIQHLGKDDTIIPLPQFKTMLAWELCNGGQYRALKEGSPF